MTVCVPGGDADGEKEAGGNLALGSERNQGGRVKRMMVSRGREKGGGAPVPVRPLMREEQPSRTGGTGVERSGDGHEDE